MPYLFVFVDEPQELLYIPSLHSLCNALLRGNIGIAVTLSMMKSEILRLKSKSDIYIV
jgi:hypothetical protein